MDKISRCDCGASGSIIELEGEGFFCQKCRRVIDFRRGEIGVPSGLPLPEIRYNEPRPNGRLDDLITKRVVVSGDRAWSLETGRRVEPRSLQNFVPKWDGFFEGFEVQTFDPKKLRRRFEDFLRKADLEELLRASAMFGCIHGWTK
ncbi:MAG: hypothetical protein OCU18_03745 [Candidatus Syntrophoarchaeum sp.]|nr:hypothetical protein [Candidatus Syntrophoarchaeum sp.]